MSEHIYEDSDMENERYHVIPFGSMREEIVRCRDCEYWATEARFTGMCVGKQFNPDGFCKWGERTSATEVCSDDRFELIGKAKAKLLECTNIESRPEEVAVLDSVLFRCWQMGWLDKLRDN